MSAPPRPSQASPAEAGPSGTQSLHEAHNRFDMRLKTFDLTPSTHARSRTLAPWTSTSSGRCASTRNFLLIYYSQA